MSRSKRDDLRQRAPELAAFVDGCREAFGEGIKVTYLKVGNEEYGMPVERDRCVAFSDAESAESVRKKLAKFREWIKQNDEDRRKKGLKRGR